MKRYCLSHFQTFRNYSFLSEWGLPGGTMVKNLPANAADTGYVGSFPGGGGGGGRSPGEGNGYPRQYSCLENSTDGGAWWTTVHGVAKSQTQLSLHASFTQWYNLGTTFPPTLPLSQLNCVGSSLTLDLQSQSLRAGVLSLWDLMPDDLRWSWYNNNRNKVHSKFNVLEASPNHPPLPAILIHAKIVFQQSEPWYQNGWGLLL